MSVVYDDTDGRSSADDTSVGGDHHGGDGWSADDLKALVVGLVSLGAQIGIVVGGVVPYVPQFFALRRAGSTKGFSTYVCLALLVANTLRIIFWFGHHFEYPLLIQSVLMSLAMFALIYQCVSINSKETLVRGGQDSIFTAPSGNPPQKHTYTDFDLRHFWQWTDFQSYVECIVSLATIGGVLMFFLRDFQPFVQSVGFAATLTEACLGVPQFYRNFKNKSTYGMSVQMVLMWTCGDVFKTTYFYVRETPPQFIICGALQVCIDLAILLQVWGYRKNTNRRRKAELQLNT